MKEECNNCIHSFFYGKIILGCGGMYFLIGVCVLILFVAFCYFFIKFKVRSILNKTGFSGMNLKDVIEEARLEDENTPKSLASMESIYLRQIRKDFPDLNINQLKRSSEKVILDCFNAIEDKNSTGLKGKIKSFADDLIRDYKDKDVHFNNITFHNTVVSEYKKDKGIATIVFSSAFQYYLEVDGKDKKIQDRAKVEFIYIINELEVAAKENVLGIHCPNCGSPITTLGEKKCSYCGSAVIEIYSKVFTCNNILRY